MKRYYEVSKHGLIFIVWYINSDYIGDHCTKDSTWEDEDKAIEHCRLLNEGLKK